MRLCPWLVVVVVVMLLLNKLCSWQHLPQFPLTLKGVRVELCEVIQIAHAFAAHSQDAGKIETVHVCAC